MEIRKHSDLVLVAALAALVLVVRAVAGSATAITVVPAALLVLVLPGYALSAFALPGAAANALERCALSLGVSLAVAALLGLILHLTPWGLTAGSWTVALVAVTWLGCILALFRRQAANSEVTLSPTPARFSLDTRSATMIGAAALVCGAALYVSSRPPSELASQGYTLLWAIPDAGGVPVVHVGIQNFDTGPRQYRLNAAWGDQSVQQWNVQLDVNSTWRADLDLSNQPPHLAEDLQVSLYSADDPNTPIRQTTLRTGNDPSTPVAGVAAAQPVAPAPQATVQPTVQPTPPPATPTAVLVNAAPQITSTPTAAQVWQGLLPQLDAVWGKDTPKTVQLLQDYLTQFPEDATARDKLYAALVARAEDLAAGGQADAAASDLAQAQQLLPNRLEARAALLRLTPTPTPQSQAETAAPRSAAPRPQTIVRQPTPVPPPVQRAPAVIPAAPAAPPVVRTAPTPTKVPFVAPGG